MTFEYAILDVPFGKNEKATEKMLDELGGRGFELVAVVLKPASLGGEAIQRLYLKKREE